MRHRRCRVKGRSGGAVVAGAASDIVPPATPPGRAGGRSCGGACVSVVEARAGIGCFSDEAGDGLVGAFCTSMNVAAGGAGCCSCGCAHGPAGATGVQNAGAAAAEDSVLYAASGLNSC